MWNPLRQFVSKKALLFFMPLLLSSHVLADVEPIKILFIGNSYTHMNDMPSIFEKIAKGAGKTVVVEKNTKSGASFKVHAQREDMYEAIKKRKWDYVILQGFSRECSYLPAHMDTATIPYVQQITDSIYANNPCTNVLLYMTWGYAEGYKEREEVDTYEKMADSIAKGYTYLSEYFKVPIVPVGMVWKQIKQQGKINLYAEDKAHPSINGSFLIASTFYSAIFDESGVGVYTKTVKSDYAETIKSTAFSYVKKNWFVYKLDANRFTLKPRITPAGDYILEVGSIFPTATAVTWYFGDGNKLDNYYGVHKYKNHGVYTVKIKVQDSCGIHMHERLVEYKKPEKPIHRKRHKPKYNTTSEKKV